MNLWSAAPNHYASVTQAKIPAWAADTLPRQRLPVPTPTRPDAIRLSGPPVSEPLNLAIYCVRLISGQSCKIFHIVSASRSVTDSPHLAFTAT